MNIIERLKSGFCLNRYRVGSVNKVVCLGNDVNQEGERKHDGLGDKVNKSVN